MKKKLCLIATVIMLMGSTLTASAATPFISIPTLPKVPNITNSVKVPDISGSVKNYLPKIVINWR